MITAGRGWDADICGYQDPSNFLLYYTTENLRTCDGAIYTHQANTRSFSESCESSSEFFDEPEGGCTSATFSGVNYVGLIDAMAQTAMVLGQDPGGTTLSVSIDASRYRVLDSSAGGGAYPGILYQTVNAGILLTRLVPGLSYSGIIYDRSRADSTSDQFNGVPSDTLPITEVATPFSFTATKIYEIIDGALNESVPEADFIEENFNTQTWAYGLPNGALVVIPSYTIPTERGIYSWREVEVEKTP